MLVKRESPGAGTAPASLPPPPALNTGVYLSVPLFNKRADLLALTIPFIVFSWVCSVSRLYVRLFAFRAAGWDDLFIVLALVCTTMCSILLCIAPDFGFGTSVYALSLPEIEKLIKIMYIGNFPYPLSAALFKLALLFQYLRIFEPRSKQSLLCKCLAIVVFVWGLIFAAITWVPCVPLAAFWDFSITDARCWGFGSHDIDEFMRYFVGQAITTALLDFIIFVIPAHLYFKPATEKKTRVALLCLFGLGLCVNICSLWRMAYVIQLARAGTGSFDPTWYSPTAAGLANIEAHLAVACAGLPIFWPSLERAWNRVFVTYEVSVTTDYGQFPSKPKDVELQSISSDKNLTLDPAQMPEGWEPFVGDETTGLGESETVIESLANSKRSWRVKHLFQRQLTTAP
ncbi:hypothetical protein B0T25DRAFT_585273 [Lasiosphaeria hispida]|uniref:Rhodopsin domain-containing protein n=1 Tax=Lasiosphaeria hispida TaxID=260671 RepID=A0AAJ0MA30_9PEZI|nr:hypothetical protein B0T25DRAFT_585273 [Lasiosphaeria hispida]